MPEDEFKELENRLFEFTSGFDPHNVNDDVYEQFKIHRKLVIELAHRLHRIEALLKEASCPGNCGQGECAFCWDRNIEFDALQTFYKEYEL
jgi:hypothetical protein